MEDKEKTVPMFRTNIRNLPAGVFSGNLVVSMRPYPADKLHEVQSTLFWLFILLFSEALNIFLISKRWLPSHRAIQERTGGRFIGATQHFSALETISRVPRKRLSMAVVTVQLPLRRRVGLTRRPLRLQLGGGHFPLLTSGMRWSFERGRCQCFGPAG
jgi:hypothetical protein